MTKVHETEKGHAPRHVQFLANRLAIRMQVIVRDMITISKASNTNALLDAAVTVEISFNSHFIITDVGQVGHLDRPTACLERIICVHLLKCIM